MLQDSKVQQRTIQGVPIAPQSMIFMDKDFDSGLRLGKSMLREIGAAGANIRDGVFVDIGCGWGRVTYALLDGRFKGSYIGVDVMKKRINFLKKAFAREGRYRFHALAVNNDRYNKVDTTEKFDALALIQEPASTIIMLSVFTHMYEDDIRHYLSELRKVIADDGHLVATAFLLTPQAIEATAQRRGRFSMPHRISDHCRTERPDEPLFAIAYDLDFFKGLIGDAGFSADYRFGSWSGAEGERLQDWMVLRPV